MVSRSGSRTRRLIITGVVAAGLGAGGTGVALASAGSNAATATAARTTSDVLDADRVIDAEFIRVTICISKLRFCRDQAGERIRGRSQVHSHGSRIRQRDRTEQLDGLVGPARLARWREGSRQRLAVPRGYAPGCAALPYPRGR